MLFSGIVFVVQRIISNLLFRLSDTKIKDEGTSVLIGYLNAGYSTI